MDIEELEKIYKSVLWKVEYNRNRMINFKDDNYAVSKVANWQWTI